MKSFRTIIALLVFTAFFMSTDMNAQEKWGNSGKYEMNVIFECPCAGEWLQGNMVFQVKSNGKMYLETFKGHLTGVETGEKYVFSRIDHVNTETGQSSLRVRTKRKSDGIVTHFTIFFQDGQVQARCY